MGFSTLILWVWVGFLAYTPEAVRLGPESVPLGLDLYRPTPENNPLTAEKIDLGKRLFFEPLLSRSESISCADCHQPKRAFTDGGTLSVGVFGRVGTRNVPTLINRAYGKHFFWDGRILTLEEQVLQPIHNPIEMGLSLEEAVSRLRDHRGYSELFHRAFGRSVTVEDLSFSLASFVRTVLSGNSPYDRYVFGDPEALTEDAREGLRLFRGKARCTQCHIGPNLTDEDFHNTGVAWSSGSLLDKGRFLVTGQEEDQGAFKTPTLREIGRTAPYMHDGSLSDLRAVIAYYERGGNMNPYLDARIRPLALSRDEKEDLLAFLHSLSGSNREGL